LRSFDLNHRSLAVHGAQLFSGCSSLLRREEQCAHHQAAQLVSVPLGQHEGRLYKLGRIEIWAGSHTITARMVGKPVTAADRPIRNSITACELVILT
jgi:hypothetical protein